MLGKLKSLLSPATLKAHAKAAYTTNIAWGKNEVKNNSIQPFFWAMVITGTVGYAAEYMSVGRYHVMHKHKIIDDAMKAHGHH